MNTRYQNHIKIRRICIDYSLFPVEINYKYMIRYSSDIKPVLNSRELTLGVF